MFYTFACLKQILITKYTCFVDVTLELVAGEAEN